MLSQVFTKDDHTLYTTWSKEEGGIIILVVPGVGEIRMTLEKATEISDDMARQAEYARWDAIENRSLMKEV